MYKIKIRLDTQSEIKDFVDIANSIKSDISLVDNAGHNVNAKSFLGCLYSVEFDEVYVTSDDATICTKFNKFRSVGD